MCVQYFFFFQAEDGIRDYKVTGVQTCALPICPPQIVPSQLNTFTALGKAIIIVLTMNVMPRSGFMPEINMWWPHTINPKIGRASCRERVKNSVEDVTVKQEEKRKQ